MLDSPMDWIDWIRVFIEGYVAGMFATVVFLALAKRAR